MNENFLLASRFAQNFNKKYGVITYSGTLAIEVALSNLGFVKGDKVLVLSEVCYSIVNTILKLELIPVIVTSKNRLYLTDEDIDNVLEKQDIKCILLVHQYGILNKINLEKYRTKGIKIIEDVAQSWDIGSDNYKIGEHCDIVVTSFGKTKPLSYGIGGGVFFNDKSIFKFIDYCDNESRENENILLSYAYPLCKKINYDNLKNVADGIVFEQRMNSERYKKLFSKSSIVKYIKSNDNNVWHRFPIWVDDERIYHCIINKLSCTELEYQLPHEVELSELKRNKNSVHYNYNIQSKFIILLRTRNINIDKQIKILEGIIDNLV